MSVPLSSNMGTWIGTVTIPNTPSPTPWPSNVGTSSVQVIAANNPSRASLYFYNPGNTNTIWICPALSATGTALTAVANGAGCVPIPPLSGFPMSGSALQAWNAISTGANSPFTIWEYSL